SGDLPVGIAQVLMKPEVFGLETIGCAAATPCRSALQPYLDRDVENDSQVRLEIADGDALHRIEHTGRDLPQPALISARRIRKTVAEYPEAAAERRLNDGTHMVVASGREQQRLGGGPQQVSHRPNQQNAADSRPRAT